MLARHAKNKWIKGVTISGTEKERRIIKRCELPQMAEFHFALSMEMSKRSVSQISRSMERATTEH